MNLENDELVSVIVPVYNVDGYLRECVDSILAQSHSNIEVILIDDGSTDSSPALCDHYAAADCRVSVIHQANGGQSRARNAGLDIAAGEWIMFVDSDDVVAPFCVESLLRAAQSHGADIATASMVGGEQCPRLEALPCRRERVLSGADAASATLYQTSPSLGLDTSPCAKLFSRRVLAGARFPEGMIYEDLLLLPILLSEAGKVASTDRVVYFYRSVAGSTLGSFSPRRFDALRACDSLVELFSGNAALSKAAADRRLSASFNMLMLMGRHGHTDPAQSLRCVANIKRQRLSSLLNPKVRLRNKAAILLSYLLTPRSFQSATLARFLTR